MKNTLTVHLNVEPAFRQPLVFQSEEDIIYKTFDQFTKWIINNGSGKVVLTVKTTEIIYWILTTE